MFARRPNLPVLVCLLLSLALHLTVLLPLVSSSLHHEGRSQYIAARFDPEDFTAPDETPPPTEMTPLGIDADTPMSMTWVGYDEYQEHIAALAEMDQAAFNDDPVAALPVELMAIPEETVTETETTAEPEFAEQTMMDPENLMALRGILDTLSALLNPPPKEKAIQSEEVDASTKHDPKESEITKATPTEPPPPMTPGTPGTPGTTGIPTTGEQSDKESDATSVIDANPENWKAGKPLASPGLDIKTRKPSLTVLQSITMVAKNPLCRIKFDRNGIPTAVEFIEKSGSREFDDAISASLYRWRAEGKRLKKLEREETADVVIRIIIHGR